MTRQEPRAFLNLALVLLALGVASVGSARGAEKDAAQMWGQLAGLRVALHPDRISFLRLDAESGHEDPVPSRGGRAWRPPVGARERAAGTWRPVAELVFANTDPGCEITGLEPRPTGAKRYVGVGPQLRLQPRDLYGGSLYRGLWPGVDLLVEIEAAELCFQFREQWPGALAAVAWSWDTLADDPGCELIREASLESAGSLAGDGADRGGGKVRVATAQDTRPTSGLPVRPRVPADFAWGTFLGGGANEIFCSIAAGNTGVAYLVGETESADFPATTGAFQEGDMPDQNAYVVAIDATTGLPLWTTLLVGDGDDVARDVCVLRNGNVAIAGVTGSTDFPTTPGVSDSTRDQSYATFVAELDAATGQLVWCTLIDGANALAVAQGPDSAVYVAGDVWYGGLTVTPGVFDPTFSGGVQDAFMAQVSERGTRLDWCTYLGDLEDEAIWGIACSHDGCPIAVGDTRSRSFPTTPGSLDRYLGGLVDAFATKLSSDGSRLIWSTYVGGGINDYLYDIAVLPNGDLLLGGETGSDDFPVPAGQPFLVRRGYDDGVVLRMAPDGASLIWTTLVGGNDTDGVANLQDDGQGLLYVGGATKSTVFPDAGGGPDLVTAGAWDGFIVRLSGEMGVAQKTMMFGGSDVESWPRIALVAPGVLVAAGLTFSADFPVTAGCFDNALSGQNDVFVLSTRALATPVLLRSFTSERRGPQVTVRWTLAPAGIEPVAQLWRGAQGQARVLVAERTGWESTYVDEPAPDGELTYWLKLRDEGGEGFWLGPTVVEGSGVPEALALTSIAPNPFNPRTTIRFELPRAGWAVLALYDLRGRRVRTLVEGFKMAGYQSIEWDGLADGGLAVPSGVYFARLETEAGVRTTKLTLAR